MKRPKQKYPQGERTNGMLQFEVTLHFKLYPAGWAGNDEHAFKWPFHALKALLELPIWNFRINEKVAIGEIRWRRTGETWQRWKRPVR